MADEDERRLERDAEHDPAAAVALDAARQRRNPEEPPEGDPSNPLRPSSRIVPIPVTWDPVDSMRLEIFVIRADAESALRRADSLERRLTALESDRAPSAPRTIAERIVAILRQTNPLATGELVSILGGNPRSLRTILYRMKMAGTIVREPLGWRLRA